MKRCLAAVLSLFWFVAASAQVQVGYVKTIGRPNKQGKPLAGVALRFRGVVNAVTSTKEGKFAIHVAGKKEGDACYLMRVAKKDMSLQTADACQGDMLFRLRCLSR